MQALTELLTGTTYTKLSDLQAVVGLPESGAWVRTNMVTSLTGALKIDSDSAALSNPVDRALMGCIRKGAEAVVVGANTVRTENYAALDRGILVAISSSGRVYSDNFDAHSRIIVATHAGTEIATNAGHTSILELGEHDVTTLGPAGATLKALQHSGVSRIVCEGGRGVMSSAIDSGLVTDLGLSVQLATGGESTWASPRTVRHWHARYLLLDRTHHTIYSGYSAAKP